MGSEQKVIESYRCVWRFRVSVRILRFDRLRVEKRGCADGVAGEAEDVERGKVDCEAECGFALVVCDGLRVEGGAPAAMLVLRVVV
jgi:hypothetical protein